MDTKPTETEKHTPVSTEDLNNKYPTPRGFTGFFWYHVSMRITKILVKLRSAGRENIPVDNPYIVCSNHQTYADGMWIMSFLPRKHRKYFCSLAASDLETNYGRLGRVMMHVGRGIAVDRYGNPVRGLIKAKKEVDEGNILFVFPEGTRTASGKLGELKDGAAYIAIKSGTPLIPVYISGAYQIWPRQSKHPHPFKGFLKRRKIRIYVGEPIYGKDYNNDAHLMTAALSDWMHDMEDKHYEPEA